MLPWSELQAAFRRALEGHADPALLAEIVADGLTADARLDIYRHHVRTTLTEVLAAAYPVVCRLVDRRFFAYAADRYIAAHLPASPCLAEYGSSFPQFLAEFPPCRDLPYLADVARLEWALHVARHADDASPLDPARLAALPPEETPAVTLRLDPSVSYVSSPWPIDAIWRAHQADGGADEPIDLAAGSARLEIRRSGDDVVFRQLDASTWALRHALREGCALDEAADRALALRSDFPLAPALRDLLDEGIAVNLDAPSLPREVS